MRPENKQIVADPIALALQALAWTLTDPGRADRMLALTGLDGDDLRQRAADPALLAAVLGFLAAHEPDLVACAAAIGVPAEQLEIVRELLER